MLTFIQPRPVSDMHSHRKMEQHHDEHVLSLANMYKVDQEWFRQAPIERIVRYTELVHMLEQRMAKDSRDSFMTKEELGLFNKTLSKADAYLEFGIGGSTVFASQFQNLHCLKGIATNENWIGGVSTETPVATALAQGRLELVFVDIGPTIGNGFPDYYADGHGRHVEHWNNYCAQNMTSCAGQPVKNRVVLVDGRFRVACFLKTLLAINSDEGSKTQILFHDYHRPAYHVVQKFADIVEIPGERMCVIHYVLFFWGIDSTT